MSAAPAPANYPSEWEADVVLADGHTVHVRPIRPDDGPALESLHSRLSAESVYLRFFSPLPRLSPALLERFTHVDYDDRLALVAELGDDVVAVARFDRLPDSRDAEVAFVVADEHQGRGLATLLLEHLAAAARERGIERFLADTLPGNERMLAVFHDAGFAEERRYDDGVIRVTFPIEATAASVAVSHDREQRAAARSVQRLLAPRSVAVIGASRREHTIGHEILVNLLGGGFQGPVYPVHPSAHQVASVRAFPSVLDIPDTVDLAVIVVPAATVPAVVDECGRKQVGGLVVISAGFADAGAEGAAAERRLVEQARRHGMRMIGPNCMGVVNSSPAVSMNASVAPSRPVRGRVGFSSQSGALGVAILDELNRIGIGVSTFVSLGNKADVSSNDLLHFWAGDTGTDVVLLHLERFGNPRTFARVVRRLSRSKPVVAVKSARRGPSEAAVGAMFRQSGVIRVDNLEQLFDVAQLLVRQPRPAGRRVAIMGNGHGPAVLAADACEGQGMELADLSDPTLAALGSSMAVAPARSVGNPIDLGTAATAADYERALGIVLADDSVDAAIVLFVPPLAVPTHEVTAAVARAAATQPAKPVAACVMAGRADGPGASPLADTREVADPGGPVVPTYRFPEAAALALARVADYADWCRRPEGAAPVLGDVDRPGARALVEGVLASEPSGSWLGDADARRLLACYGVVVPDGGADAPDADDGAVVDTVVGVVQDPSFGPVLTFGVAGLAGSLAGGRADRSVFELLGEPAHRVLPLTDRDASDLVRSVRGAALLLGWSGRPAVDLVALEGLLLRVAALAEEVPEVAEIDMRPVAVAPGGVSPATARVRLAPWRPRPELAVRRLR